jgi:hypothetical protein
MTKKGPSKKATTTAVKAATQEAATTALERAPIIVSLHQRGEHQVGAAVGWVDGGSTGGLHPGSAVATVPEEVVLFMPHAMAGFMFPPTTNAPDTEFNIHVASVRLSVRAVHLCAPMPDVVQTFLKTHRYVGTTFKSGQSRLPCTSRC